LRRERNEDSFPYHNQRPTEANDYATPDSHLLIILLFPPTLAAVGGWLAGPSFLHPIRRELSPDLIREADVTFEQIGVHREAFDVRAPDAVLLRGWKVARRKTELGTGFWSITAWRTIAWAS